MTGTGSIDTIQWDRDFKVLCDGLLRFELGKLVQTFGSDGSDGGVDAEFNGRIDGVAGRWVFQYKFRSTKEAVSKRRSWLTQRYVGPKSEFDKEGVKAASGYILLTNVPVTPGIVAKLKKEWRNRKHKGPLCVWDPSQLNAMMKGREHLARSWSGAKEARCLQMIIVPLWEWLQGAYAVSLDWMQDPLWPLDIISYQYPSPVSSFNQNFRWDYGLRLEPRVSQLEHVGSDPQFEYAASIVYPRALTPLNEVRGAIDALARAVLHHIEAVRDELAQHLPQLALIKDQRERDESTLALAYCLLENRWGFPMRGLHSVRDGHLIISGRRHAWQEQIPGIEQVLDNLLTAVPHGLVDRDVVDARTRVAERLNEWWQLLWQVVSFGIDAEVADAGGVQ